MTETFGKEVVDGYLDKIGITEDKYLNQEKIDPSILLHKYIDTHNEKAAIELITKDGGDIDVNLEFNTRIPVFAAINGKMCDLFDAIINHPKFDVHTESGFGDTILENLLYLYGTSEINISDDDKQMIKKMINSIITSSNKFDFNELDLNGDTALTCACQFPNEVWVVKNLASRKDVNVNIINGFGYNCLKHCVINSNLNALAVIGQRPDLVVSEEDIAFAKKNGVDLKEYIKPNDNFFNENNAAHVEESLEEAFSMASLS